jgi:mRNA interferase RelE/StbE
MKYRLWIKNEAKAEIKKLPGNMRQVIRRAVKELADEPRPHASAEMRTPEGIEQEVRRIRLVPWRIIYLIDEEFLEVGVLAVRKRPPYNYEDLSMLLKDIAD